MDLVKVRGVLYVDCKGISCRGFFRASRRDSFIALFSARLASEEWEMFSWSGGGGGGGVWGVEEGLSIERLGVYAPLEGGAYISLNSTMLHFNSSVELFSKNATVEITVSSSKSFMDL